MEDSEFRQKLDFCPSVHFTCLWQFNLVSYINAISLEKVLKQAFSNIFGNQLQSDACQVSSISAIRPIRCLPNLTSKAQSQLGLVVCVLQKSRRLPKQTFFADLERSHVDLAQVLIEISQKNSFWNWTKIGLLMKTYKNRTHYKKSENYKSR